LNLFDTDVFSHYLAGHVRVPQNLAGHLGDQFAVSVVTVEEQLAGWQQELSRARDDHRRAEVYRRMAQTVEYLSAWRVLPLSVLALAHAATLRKQRLNVGSNDLKIAATAIEVRAIVVTRNLRDFRRVPGVVCEDWTV
jgi:tRNA(fMet)-specific endonuclease VapC